MKTFLITLLLCAILAGCAAAPTAPMAPPDIAQPPEAEEIPAAPPEASPTATVIYTLYFPNDDAETFTEVIIETDQISADTVLAALREYEILPDTVMLNSFGSTGTQLIMDFNQAFGDLVCSTGTSGERMITGAVFNTFLSAFQAESVIFTVEGEILESGHIIYDFPITYID